MRHHLRSRAGEHFLEQVVQQPAPDTGEEDERRVAVHALEHEEADNRGDGHPEDGRPAEGGDVERGHFEPGGTDRLSRIVSLAQRRQHPLVELQRVALENLSREVEDHEDDAEERERADQQPQLGAIPGRNARLQRLQPGMQLHLPIITSFVPALARPRRA